MIPNPANPQLSNWDGTPFSFQVEMDQAIGKLFIGLLGDIQEHCQFYSNRIDYCLPLVRRMMDVGCRGTLLATSTLPLADREKLLNDYGYSRLAFQQTDQPEWHRPLDRFHYGFGVFPFVLDWTDDTRKQVTFLPVQDKMLHWRASQGKPDRKAPAHLIGLEGLMRATMIGGYFGTIVPKRYVGREQSYMRWWNDRAALVARVALPESAMVAHRWKWRWPGIDPHYENAPDENRLWESERHDYDDTLPGEWELLLFQHTLLYEGAETPNSEKHAAHRHAPHLEFRFAPFIYPLLSLGNSEINRCLESFRRHEWYRLSVQRFNQVVKRQVSSSWCGTYHSKPHELPKLEEVFFLEPNDKHKYQLQVLPLSQIKKLPNAVQIKVTSRVKLGVYKPEAAGLLLDVRQADGTLKKPDGTIVYQLDEALHRKTFSELREELIAKLSDAGLLPCMTPIDYQRFIKRDRWLSIQLTPIERSIPLQKAASTDAMSSDEKAWEVAYEDTGMWATHPEVMQEWVKRAKKLRLLEDEILYPFQHDGVIVLCAKQSALVGDVMGLGKTRQTLLAAILRGVSRMLIVCPSRLIDVWRDEIERTIVPFMRRRRRNWNGKLFDPSINVIQYARDCEPEQLRFFNIISYDTLRRTPKDVTFYRCPVCETVICRKSQRPDLAPPTCPGNPLQAEEERCSHKLVMWRLSNQEQGEQKVKRKIKVVMDEDGTPLNYPGTNDPWRVHWDPAHPSRQEFPEERTMVLDQRPPKPVVPTMEPLDRVYKKMTTRIIGYEAVKDANGFETGEKRPLLSTKARVHVAWTFADIIRWRFNLVAPDEALNFKNPAALRTRAMTHLCGRSRWSLTGTPMKGLPQNILAILNWTFRREVLPDYRPYDMEGESRFLKKYSTEVTVIRDGNWAERQEPRKQRDSKQQEVIVIGGTKKQVAKVNNVEMFQAEIAPLMLRRVRTEPQVVASIPRKIIERHDLRDIEMDPQHRAYYQLWLQKFAEWYIKMKEEEEGRNVRDSILTKLTYLINASTIPHFMLEPILKGKDDEAKKWAETIGVYKGPATAKVLRARQLVLEAHRHGDKAIVFSCRHRNQDINHKWAEKKHLNSMIVDGRVPLKPKAGKIRGERHELVEAFKLQNYDVMWAGLGAMGEGFNIPEANWGIILDADWDDTAPRQAMGRMIRPAQTKTIYSYYLMHKGTIDDYMMALCYLKGRSANEGIDYMNFDDFSGEMVPDIQQYANWIVDGTEEKNKAKMWTAIEQLRASGADDDDVEADENEDDTSDDEEDE